MRRTVRTTAGAVTGAALAVAAVSGLAAPAYGADTALVTAPDRGAPVRGAAPLAAVTATTATTTGVALLAAPRSGSAASGLEVLPYSVEPGGQVTVNTKACGGTAAAAGDASAVGAGSFPLAPGARSGDATGGFRVPESAQPGTYEIVAECAEGGREVRGDLVVALTVRPGQEQVRPRGSVKTGVGGALGRDPVQTAAGVAALAVAGAGGTWLLHRRARGDGI
ncbi:conserved hypothetical protein [Streptomyces sp. e14]|uniref:hypothetical protein n=1 Tax=Streptomyces sp. e14 TaxID=645465 RepID=UPI0001D05A55|nr:hypothetical protein [Streptomyces sp. e14]EFF90897.1 conserved hypothetical protein [Streptomyces sp. e14]